MNLSVLTRVVPDSGIWAVRSRFEEVFGRLGAGVWPILQTAVAASLAWFLASAALGHDQPFFAAIAAVISTGVVVGQEGRRAIELVFGVACGLAVADLLVLAIGTGTVQIGIVVALAMAAAMMLGGGTLLITEAGVSALLAITLEPSTTGLSPERFIDALVGSGVALAVRAVFPSDPRHIVERAAHPIFDDLVGVLEETAAALRACDLGQAERALQKAREMDGRMGAFREALDAGYDTVRLSPPRRRALGQLGLYATAADQLDLAVRNVRVLARAAAAAVREGEPAPEALSETSAISLVPWKPSQPTSKSPSIPWRPAGSPSKPRRGQPPYSWSVTTSGPACWWARSGQPPWTCCGPLAWTRPSPSKRSAMPPTVQPRSPQTRPPEPGRCSRFLGFEAA